MQFQRKFINNMAHNIPVYLYYCQSGRPYFAEHLTLASNKYLSFQITDYGQNIISFALQHALWREPLDVGTEEKITGQNNQKLKQCLQVLLPAAA